MPDHERSRRPDPGQGRRRGPAQAAHVLGAQRPRPLAVATHARTAAQPDLPTVSESGVEGFDISTWFGVFAPAGLPVRVRDRPYRPALAGLESPKRAAALNTTGAQPAPMARMLSLYFIRAEQRKYEAVVRSRVPWLIDGRFTHARRTTDSTIARRVNRP